VREKAVSREPGGGREMEQERERGEPDTSSDWEGDTVTPGLGI
jgi:hypothetical protein